MLGYESCFNKVQVLNHHFVRFLKNVIKMGTYFGVDALNLVEKGLQTCIVLFIKSFESKSFENLYPGFLFLLVCLF